MGLRPEHHTLKCLKVSGIDDPNLDLLLSAATLDDKLREKALARGADVNIKIEQLISKYRDVLQKNWPDELKAWDESAIKCSFCGTLYEKDKMHECEAKMSIFINGEEWYQCLKDGYVYPTGTSHKCAS